MLACQSLTVVGTQHETHHTGCTMTGALTLPCLSCLCYREWLRQKRKKNPSLVLACFSVVGRSFFFHYSVSFGTNVSTKLYLVITQLRSQLYEHLHPSTLFVSSFWQHVIFQRTMACGILATSQRGNTLSTFVAVLIEQTLRRICEPDIQFLYM